MWLYTARGRYEGSCTNWKHKADWLTVPTCAVADLLQFLEQRNETDFFHGEPLKALTTLSFSENVDLQRSAALAFAEITEKQVLFFRPFAPEPDNCSPAAIPPMLTYERVSVM